MFLYDDRNGDEHLNLIGLGDEPQDWIIGRADTEHFVTFSAGTSDYNPLSEIQELLDCPPALAFPDGFSHWQGVALTPGEIEAGAECRWRYDALGENDFISLELSADPEYVPPFATGLQDAQCLSGVGVGVSNMGSQTVPTVDLPAEFDCIPDSGGRLRQKPILLERAHICSTREYHEWFFAPPNPVPQDWPCQP